MAVDGAHDTIPFLPAPTHATEALVPPIVAVPTSMPSQLLDERQIVAKAHGREGHSEFCAFPQILSRIQASLSEPLIHLDWVKRRAE